MARYRKVEVRMWGDARFSRLSPIPPSGQALWLRLLTGPETTAIPGLIISGELALCEALGWSREAFREAFGEVFAEGMAKADFKARLIWLPKAVRHNRPESPNVIRSWGKVWPEVPECDLKALVFQELKAFAEAFGEAYAEAFREAFGEGYAESGTGTGAVSGAVTGAGEGECRGGAAPTLWPVETPEQNSRRSAPVAPDGASLTAGASRSKPPRPKPAPVRLPPEIEDEPIPASVRVPESFGACATLGDLWRARIKQAKRVGRKFTDSAMEKQARQVVQLVAKEGATKAARVLVLLGERGWQGIDLELCDRELAKEDGRRPVNGFGGGFDRDAAHRRLATAGVSAEQWAMIEALDAKLNQEMTNEQGG